MSHSNKPPSSQKTLKNAEKDSKKARLAKALRDNLLKRKKQMNERKTSKKENIE